MTSRRVPSASASGALTASGVPRILYCTNSFGVETPRDSKRGKEMRNRFTAALVGLAAALVFSLAVAPMAHSQSGQEDPSARWRFNPKDFPEGGGGPAPKHDLTGTWAGPGSSPLVPRAGGRGAEKPELTPYGEKLMSQAKPIGKYSPAGTNDPHARYCDPVGFPQNAYTEARGLTIATMPDRVVHFASVS